METIVVIIGFVIFALFMAMLKLNQLNDPENTTIVTPEQLASLYLLKQGACKAVLIRQSGNVYRELGEFQTPEAALNEVLKSLGRARIDAVSIYQNTSERLEIHRTFHNHRGRQEGKKLGGALIISLG